jgi:hypothetical protein
VIGPIVGPFVQANLSWHWICWTQLIFGGFVQVLHFFVPETRASVLLDREARRRRKNGQSNVYGPNEVREHRFSAHEIIKTWTRPFIMFVSEPIVLWCSLLSGFSDALIFTFLEAFTPGEWYGAGSDNTSHLGWYSYSSTVADPVQYTSSGASPPQ